MSEVEINKYQKGKIYKIWNDINDEIYVGSTCCMLCKRMSKHRDSMKVPDKQHRSLYQLMAELGKEKFHIELVEEFLCNNVKQLKSREGHYIRQIGTLNMRIEGRTQKEYRDGHKEEMSEYQQIYREAHKSERVEYLKKYTQENKHKTAQYEKERCRKNQEVLCQYKKEWYNKKKEAIREQGSVKMNCPCGSVFRCGEKARHLKSAKHKKYEEQNQ